MREMAPRPQNSEVFRIEGRCHCALISGLSWSNTNRKTKRRSRGLDWWWDKWWDAIFNLQRNRLLSIVFINNSTPAFSPVSGYLPGSLVVRFPSAGCDERLRSGRRSGNRKFTFPKKPYRTNGFKGDLAERVGFEPTEGSRPHLISSQARSASSGTSPSGNYNGLVDCSSVGLDHAENRYRSTPNGAATIPRQIRNMTKYANVCQEL